MAQNTPTVIDCSASRLTATPRPSRSPGCRHPTTSVPRKSKAVAGKNSTDRPSTARK